METPVIQFVTRSADFVYHVEKNRVWSGYFIVCGAGSLDISITCILDGEHADATTHIVNVLSGAASVTLKTLQHHRSKNARSNVLVKTVVTDTASFVFDGSIRVDKNADKTDAYERNVNLILSEDAKVTTNPALEILAHDVRCTHSAATGEIPFDELWYLMTRRLSEGEAQRLYVQGFVNSALTGLPADTSEEIVHRIMDI